MSFNSIYKFPIPSSRLTTIRQNKMIYANYISKVQANNQGCDTARTGLTDGNVAPGSIIPDLLDGARNTTAAERDAILDSTECPVAPTPTPAPIPTLLTSGLVLYYDAGKSDSYPGSGTSVFDLSPSAYTGTLTNGTTYSAVNGGTFVFDGTNDYINTNNSIGLEDFTLNAWFNLSDVTNYRMLISKEVNAGQPWNYRMYINITDGCLVGDIAQTGGAFVQVYDGTSANLADGTWHMTSFSRNSTTHKANIYTDGVLIKSVNETLVGSIINAQNCWIGASDFGAGTALSYPFKGNIAEAFIYNYAQSESDILYNYNATKTRFGL